MSKIKMFALGGLNEVGKNMYVVEVGEDIYIFEAGLKYADDQSLGIDYIIPNYDYLKENKERIIGIFITHGHDEHMGALADILEDIPDIPIYATAFTLEMIKQDLEADEIDNANLIELEIHKKVEFGKNSIFPVRVSHSIPNSVMYVLYTEDGAIIFTGNYVFDPSMTGAFAADIGKIAYVGKQGVLCLLGESIYAPKKGFTSPHHRAREAIREALNKNEGRILLNLMQTQIFRIQELFYEVTKTNRNVVIMGKKLEGNILKAIELGYVDFDKDRIKPIRHVNDEGVIVIISNEREVPYYNIKRIIKGYDKFIKLTEEDTVMFASPIYDSIEVTSSQVFDDIAKIGCNLIILSKKQYRSPHASSEDVLMMLNMLNPKYYFPVIGEYREQVENANLAYSLGMPKENVFLKINGDAITLLNGNVQDTSEKIKTDEILIDGKQSGDIGDLVLKDRELLGENGIVMVTTTLDKQAKNVLAGPEILTRGFIYVKDNNDLIKEAEKISLEVVNEFINPKYVDFNKIKLGIREKLGKYLYQQTSSKPMIIVVVQEV
jgi:Predicted hydrolase of the metallo-beta-lactamase superfamily